MSILLWITIEMEYKIKYLKFILFFTNGRQKLTAEGLNLKQKIYSCRRCWPTAFQFLTLMNFIKLKYLFFSALLLDDL